MNQETVWRNADGTLKETLFRDINGKLKESTNPLLKLLMKKLID